MYTKLYFYGTNFMMLSYVEVLFPEERKFIIISMRNYIAINDEILVASD